MSAVVCDAAARIGVAVVTLNIRYRERELGYMLNQSGARLVVSAAVAGEVDLVGFYAEFRDRISAVEEVLFLGAGPLGSRYGELLVEPGLDLAAAEEAVRPDDPAVILYTSGTTGTPKGAVLTHAGLLGAARAQVEHLGTGPTDVQLGMLPLNHVGGLTCTIVSALLARATVVLHPVFSPEAALADIAAHRVTLCGAVPTMWTLMLGHPSFAQHDLSSLRSAVIGGSNADPTLCAAIVAACPNARLTNLYGLSECSGACVMSPLDDDLAAVSRSVGRPLGGVEATVLNADGEEVADGEEGELHVRGPGTAAGYWGLPDATAETFLPDGWLATGDMVTREPDGHLVLRGRRNDMFIQGGYNVYPVEVENVLAAHPGVAMAAGIGVPDPVLGEVGLYYIVARPGMAPTAGELSVFCAARLADYKVPRRIEFAQELPTTPAGKIAKSVLRARSDTANGAAAT